MMMTVTLGFVFGFVGFLFTPLGSGMIYFAIVGAVIGGIIDLVRKSHENTEKEQASRMKKTEIYKVLIAEDRIKIIGDIRVSASTVTKDTPLDTHIYLRSHINDITIRDKLSSLGYQDITPKQMYELRLAIGQTEGYRLTGEYGHRNFEVDYQYYSKIIVQEISKVKSQRVYEYQKEQAGKKKIY